MLHFNQSKLYSPNTVPALVTLSVQTALRLSRWQVPGMMPWPGSHQTGCARRTQGSHRSALMHADGRANRRRIVTKCRFECHTRRSLFLALPPGLRPCAGGAPGTCFLSQAHKPRQQLEMQFFWPMHWCQQASPWRPSAQSFCPDLGKVLEFCC